MLIKLTGGWISVLHVQSIEPITAGGGGCIVRVLDATIVLEESADVVAGRINEVRSAISALASYATAGPECPEDVDAAVIMLESLVQANPKSEEAADNGEEKSEGERRANPERLAKATGRDD